MKWKIESDVCGLYDLTASCDTIRIIATNTFRNDINAVKIEEIFYKKSCFTYFLIRDKKGAIIHSLKQVE